jgi:hypothetical protein
LVAIKDWMPFMNDDNSAWLQLRQELRMLRFLVFLVVGIALLALLVANIIATLQLPHAGRVFEDIFGDPNKLPELTKLVMSYGKAADGMLSVGVVIIVPVLACTVFLLFRRSMWAMLLVGFALVFLMAHWLAISLAIKMPTQMMIGPLMPLP